jgi:glycosyltransferase involved in cell wall biosynthesis
MRINWFSNAPWCHTGYGNQTRLFTPRIKALGHDVTISALYGLDGAPMDVNGIMVYPKAHHPWGMDIVNAHAVHSKADCIISLIDLWACAPSRFHKPWFPWFPVDCEPIPAAVLATLQQTTRGIVFSKFAQEQAQNAGIDPFYVPHGVDTKVFRMEDRQEAREILGFPTDAFIVGMVANNKGNPPRKSFFEQIAAFTALKKQRPDALLYLHTDDGTHGGETVNLLEFCGVMRLKPKTDVIFCDQYEYTLGFNDDYMRHIYNSMDVLMNASMGEGFGLPIVEAQACGCPVIVGDWTSMSELCFSGWKIPKEDATPIWQSFFGAFQWQVKTEAMAGCLLAAYEARDNQANREWAAIAAQFYDADLITEKYWKPTLEKIDELVSNSESKMELVTF